MSFFLLLISLLTTPAAAPPAVTLQWKAVTTLTTGQPIVGPVYYNVYRDVSGTVKYAKLNPSPLLCPAYYDNTVQSGVSYDYYVTSWTPTLGESAPSLKSGNVKIP